jgi:hypothetical protein
MKKLLFILGLCAACSAQAETYSLATCGLQWDYNVADEPQIDGYRWELETPYDSGTWVAQPNEPAPADRTDTCVEAGMGLGDNRLRLKAFNAAGESAPSNEVTAYLVDTAPPSSPTIVLFTSTKLATNCDVQWTFNAGDELQIDGYRVQRETPFDSGTWAQALEVPVPSDRQASCAAAGIVVGANRLRVVAYNAAGESAPSSPTDLYIVDAVPPAPGMATVILEP